ncbi:hypothetical protein vseg_017953 [Gypsophila vaccaria]
MKVVAVFVLLSSILVSGQITGDYGDTLTGSNTSRHLKETGDERNNDKGDEGRVSLEDYRPYDPSPSSKAKVRPAPIQHGTPLMPYIPTPKPSPPSHSNHDDRV